MWQAMRTAMFLALLLSMACVAKGQEETTVEETTEEDDVNATTTAMPETTPTPTPTKPDPVIKAVLPEGQKVELTFGGKKLIVLKAKGEVKNLEIKVATIKGPDGVEIVYPAIGESKFIEPEGYPGKILTGQAIDVKFELPDGANYGVEIDLGILFNNDGTLPVRSRRAAAPEGYDFRVNGE
jgi:hypothetical protein